MTALKTATSGYIERKLVKVMEDMPDEPVNLCSGKGTKIKQVAEIISKELNIPIEYKDLNLTLGPSKKVMNNPYTEPKISIEEGIKEVIKHVGV